MRYQVIYQKYCDGDRLTDEEVILGEEFYRNLAHDLFSAGPAFVISAKEAERIHQGLRGFRIARKEKK